MKLLRYGPRGQEKPGLLDDHGTVRDLSDHVPDFAGQVVSLAEIDKLRGLSPDLLRPVPDAGRIGACLAYVPNFFCIGLNYTQHAAETGAEPPKEPIIFSKATSALSGPFDPIIIPKGSQKTDWETELAIIIGAPCNHVSEAEALSKVAGYCIVNDVSEREFQIEHGGQWIKGKSAPTFGPAGPWLVTADEVGDPQALSMRLRLNGEVQQSNTTGDMIFSVAEIISYMSRFMTLVPGDIIATGTPEGVGMGQSPQKFLKAGDVLELEIDKLGQQRQEVRAYQA